MKEQDFDEIDKFIYKASDALSDAAELLPEDGQLWSDVLDILQKIDEVQALIKFTKLSKVTIKHGGKNES